MSTASADPTRPAAADDAQALRSLMRGGSKTFFAASLLLPRRVREPATALYGFCRVADDAIDLGDDPVRAMAELRRRLDGIYAGRPGDCPADRALAPVVREHSIPRELFDGLLEGFLWDAQGRHYQSLSDVHAYGARVAGTVGAMMALVMGARSPKALARACELGVAMQLTNIARDVGEDARNGRLYLPREWLAEERVDAEAWLREPSFIPGIARCTARLLASADELYARAEHGLAALPLDCRPAIQAARMVYAEIGRQLEREGLDSVRQRAVVPRRRKLALIGLAVVAAYRGPAQALQSARALGEVQFLVDAAAAAPPRRPALRSFDERMEWASSLYERLLEHDRRPVR